MPIQTRNVIIDDAETPNPSSVPQRPYYDASGYNERNQRRRSSHGRLNGYAVIMAAVAALVLAGFVGYVLIRFVNYIGEVNGGYPSDFDRALLNIVKAALVAAVAGPSIALALGSLGWAAQRFVIRYQNNQPASVLALLLSPRDDRALLGAMLDRYYAEREVWAAHSDLHSVQTLDASRSASDRRTFPDVPAAMLSDQPPPQDPLLGTRGDETVIDVLLRAGLINRSGNSLMIGASNGRPMYIELDECGFIAVAGKPRTGKSNTATFITAQVAMMPESVITVCDRHGKRGDSLIGYLRPIHDRIARLATDIDSIINAIDAWYEVGANRLLHSADGDIDRRFPVNLLVIDEFTALVALELLPANVLLRLVTGAIEFPKIQSHAVIIGHQWTGQLMGAAVGAPLRRVTTHRVVHRIDRQDAGFLLPSAYAAQAQSLTDGGALYMGADQAEPVALKVPYLTPRDLEVVRRMLPAAAHARSGPISGNVAGVAGVAGAPASPATPPSADRTPTERPGGRSSILIDISQDKRPELARMLLAKRNADNSYMHSIRAVQALTGMRTADVIAQSRTIGRSAEAEEVQ
jgi:hypothetical protein